MRQVAAFKNTILEQKAGAAVSVVAAYPGDQAAVPPEPPVSPRAALEVTQALSELVKLRDAGAITAEEYDTKKAKLLSRI